MATKLKITTQPCILCQKTSEVEVDQEAFERWKRGQYIQDAFPGWSPEQRELLITGTHPECWDKMFPEEEEED